MKLLRTPATLLLGGLLLSAAYPLLDLTFKAEEKSSQTKTFTDEASFQSTAFRMEVDGEEPPNAQLPDISISVSTSTMITVTDEYVSMGDGQPKVLKRTFDKLEGNTTEKVELPEGMQGDSESETKRESKLEGKSVVFTWDAKAEEYKCAFDEASAKDADEELLEELTEDMDMRGFLPGKSVKEGDTWEVSAKAFFTNMGIPGGDMKMESDKEDEEEEGPSMNSQMLENVEGKCSATYVEEREVDGKKCAVIKLVGELKTKGTVGLPMPEGAPSGASRTRSMEIAFESEGELLWNIEAGRFHSCEIQSKVNFTMRLGMNMTAPDGEHKIDQVFDFEGEAKFKAAY